MYSVKIGLYRLIDTVKWLWFQLKRWFLIEILPVLLLFIIIGTTKVTLADLVEFPGVLIVGVLALPLIYTILKFAWDFMKAILFLCYLPLYVLLYSIKVWWKEFAINVKILRKLYYR